MDQSYVCAFVNQTLVFDKFAEALEIMINHRQHTYRGFYRDTYGINDFFFVRNSHKSVSGVHEKTAKPRVSPIQVQN